MVLFLLATNTCSTKEPCYLQIPQVTFNKLSKMTEEMFLVLHTQTQLVIVQMHEYRHMHFITKPPYLMTITSIQTDHRKYKWNWLSGLGCVEEMIFPCGKHYNFRVNAGWCYTYLVVVQCER
jgi:hypothetical protein